MPARKPDLEVMPHYNAVQVAPDGPLKRQVIELAQGLMAEPMRRLDHALEVAEKAVQRYGVYLDGVMHRPPRDPDADRPARRDPDQVSFSQGQRALARVQMLLRDRLRLREQCYREARELVYARTLQRVGPRFWPLAEQAAESPAPGPDAATATAPAMTEAERQAELARVEDLLAQAAAAAAPGDAAPAQAAAATLDAPPARDAAKTPMTSRFYRFGQELMTRAGVPRPRQAELARRARAERWMLARFQAEVQALIDQAPGAA